MTPFKSVLSHSIEPMNKKTMEETMVWNMCRHVTSLSTLTRLAVGFGMKSTPTPWRMSGRGDRSLNRRGSGLRLLILAPVGDSPHRIGSPAPLGFKRGLSDSDE
jgi:hypothetical protein